MVWGPLLVPGTLPFHVDGVRTESPPKSSEVDEDVSIQIRGHVVNITFSTIPTLSLKAHKSALKPSWPQVTSVPGARSLAQARRRGQIPVPGQSEDVPEGVHHCGPEELESVPLVAPNCKANLHLNDNQNPVKWSTQTPCKEIRRRTSATIYGWECPLLTFIYPGFDCGSPGLDKQGGSPKPKVAANHASVLLVCWSRENQENPKGKKGRRLVQSGNKGCFTKPFLLILEGCGGGGGGGRVPNTL